MTKVVVDSVLLERLHNLDEPLNLGDAEGKVLARVIPTGNPSWFAATEPPISREELERRYRERGIPFTEVLARLKKL